MTAEPEPRAQLDPFAERVARNDAVFRESNERIMAVAESLEMDQRLPLPVICECADVSCTTILQVTAQQYEAVRREPTWFINAPGHVRSARGWGRVVAELDGFTIIEKIGDAGELTTELDPRNEDSP
jgi:hypothetical protein